MKRIIFFALLTVLIFCGGQAESLDAGIAKALEQVDVGALEAASGQRDLRALITRLAKGEMVWDGAQAGRALYDALLGELRGSFSRVMGLIAPALLCALAGSLQPQSRAEIGRAHV